MFGSRDDNANGSSVLSIPPLARSPPPDMSNGPVGVVSRPNVVNASSIVGCVGESTKARGERGSGGRSDGGKTKTRGDAIDLSTYVDLITEKNPPVFERVRDLASVRDGGSVSGGGTLFPQRASSSFGGTQRSISFEGVLDEPVPSEYSQVNWAKWNEVSDKVREQRREQQEKYDDVQESLVARQRERAKSRGVKTGRPAPFVESEGHLKRASKENDEREADSRKKVREENAFFFFNCYLFASIADRLHAFVVAVIANGIVIAHRRSLC